MGKSLPLKVGLVGCGRIAYKHLEAINSFPNLYKLIAICDLNPTAMDDIQSMISSNDVGRYSKLSELLSNEDLDLIAICSPSGQHAEQAVLASKFNVTTLCEKPMATFFDDGLRIIEAFDKSEADIYIVKQNRLNPTLKKLKQAIEGERFGAISIVNSNVFWTRPQSYYDAGEGWRGTWEFDGGAIMNQASHYVDLLQWLIGPVAEVHAYTSTVRKIETEDTAVVSFKWRNGAIGSLNVTMRTYPKNLEGSITILGDLGSVSIGGVALNEIKSWSFADQKKEDAEIFNSSYTPDSIYGNGHLEYYRSLAYQLIEGRGSLPTAREGLKSLEIISAIYRSARDHKATGLPLRA